MTLEELLWWRAFEVYEPFGDARADERAGTIAAMLYNVNRKKDAPSLIWSDFLPNALSAMKAKERESAGVITSSDQIAPLFAAFNERFKKRK